MWLRGPWADNKLAAIPASVTYEFGSRIDRCFWLKLVLPTRTCMKDGVHMSSAQELFADSPTRSHHYPRHLGQSSCCKPSLLLRPMESLVFEVSLALESFSL